MASQRMNDSWARVRQQIESVWESCEFGDKELQRARGSLPRMVDLIHQKSGEPRDVIMRKLSAMI